MQSSAGRNEIALNTVHTGLGAVKTWCRFKYDSWQLTANDNAHLSKYLEFQGIFTGLIYLFLASTFQTLLQNGSLTKDPAHGENLWITSELVFRMVHAVFCDAGSHQWDITIIKALCITMRRQQVQDPGM